MPYVIERLPSGKFSVKNKITGKVHAYHTTLANAQAQVRLMEMVDHNKSSIEKKKSKVKEEKPLVNYM